MGLFSFVKKAVGGIAKAGLSFATHGASDRVLKAFKGKGGSASPQQQMASAAKFDPPTPRTKRTEVITPGWGFSPESYGGDRERKRMPGRGKFSRGKRGQVYFTGGDVVEREEEQERIAARDRAFFPGRRRKRPKKPSRRPAAARSGRKRPSGGLDLKALSVAWKAEGKPGTWQDWIKAQGANFRS